jgi:hypothetical protein
MRDWWLVSHAHGSAWHAVVSRRPLDNQALQLTPSSVRSCLAVRRNSSHCIPEESGEDLEEILKVSRLTGAERCKGQEHGGKAGGVEKAQIAQTRKTCMAG